MNSKQSWVGKFAEKVSKKLGRYAIPFTTPFFALYNTHKLMECVKNEYLKIVVFAISMIYVLMSLGLAIYFLFTTKQ